MTTTEWLGLVRTFGELSSLAFIVVDQAQTIVLWSSGAERIWDRPANSAEGRALETVLSEYHPGLACRLAAEVQKGLRTEVEFRWQRQDATQHTKFHVVPWGTAGDPQSCTVIAAEDVVVQHRTEEEWLQLKASEREARARAKAESRFRELLEAAPDAILEVDQGGRIVLLNAVAEKMFGYSREELLGQTIETLIPEAQRARHVHHRANYWQHPLTRPMGSGLQLHALRKNGTTLPVEISLSPVKSDEGFRVTAVVRDVSDRKLAEEQLEKLHASFTRELSDKNAELELRHAEADRANRLKSEFLASMSHELRTPLHTIIGFSELLAEETKGPLNEQQKRFLQHIYRDSQHLLELINDVLDLSKIEAGRLELRPELFAADAAIHEVLASIRPAAAGKDLSVEISLTRGMWISADRVRFKEVFYNLLSNAIKFTPAGGAVSVSSITEGVVAHFVVRDTGIGIPPEEHDSIFDKFHQVGSTTKGVREGTGLGLAITKRLIEAHGGRIWVISQPGQGSEFHFRLPLNAREDNGSSTSRRDGTQAVVILGCMEEAARELLISYLQPQGFEVTATESPDETVQKARERNAQVVLLDLSVRTEEAWSTLERLRSTPETGSVPVIVLSVLEDDSPVLTFGAAGCLQKPVSKEDLLTVVRQHANSRTGEVTRVLVVDDEAHSRELITQVLQPAGYLVVQAKHGREALDMLAKGLPAAVIVDLMMAEMSGFELILRIKEEPAFRTIPLIVLTGTELHASDAALLSRHTMAVFLKGSSWREELVRRLRDFPPTPFEVAQ